MLVCEDVYCKRAIWKRVCCCGGKVLIVQDLIEARMLIEQDIIVEMKLVNQTITIVVRQRFDENYYCDCV